MADFWAGFGEGFGPAFESSYGRASSRREKAADRLYAEEKRLAEIERLAEVAKQERLGRLIGYKGALGEEDFRGLLPESGRTPINPEVYPADSIWTGAGPLPRQYRSLEDVMGGMGKKDRIGLEMAAKLRYAAKLEEDKREEAARLLRDKYAHEKGLLSAKQIADDFKSDFEATKARLQSKASSGVTEIPLGWLSPFREGQKKRLGIFFDTAVTDYNNASVVKRDEGWRKYAMKLAPYASTQYNFKMPPLPPGSRITETEADELWNAYLLGEGKIVEARAEVERIREKEWDVEDLTDAKDKVKDRLKGLVRGYVGLGGTDWNKHAQGIQDELMDRIMVPEDAWKVYGKMVEDTQTQKLLDQVKDSDFFGEKARNLVKEFMAHPFLRTNPEAMDFLMKNISPEKTDAWERQYKLYNDLGVQLRSPTLSVAEKKVLEEKRSFLHSRSPDQTTTPYGKQMEALRLELKAYEERAKGPQGGAPTTAPPPSVDPAPNKGMPARPERPEPEAPEAQEEGAILIDDLALSDEEKAALKGQRNGFPVTDGSGTAYRKIGDYLIPIRMKAPTLPPLPGDLGIGTPKR